MNKDSPFSGPCRIVFDQDVMRLVDADGAELDACQIVDHASAGRRIGQWTTQYMLDGVSVCLEAIAHLKARRGEAGEC